MKVLKAPVTYGFFGLNELHSLFNDGVEKSVHSDPDSQITLDFSDVLYWDISSLLWLIVALDYYQNNAVGSSRIQRIRLKLPQPPSPDIVPNDSKGASLLKSLDFLRRWRFIDALKNVCDDPNELLVEEQKGCLDGEPRYFYKKGDRELSGLIQELISVNLVDIRNLADFRSRRQERKIESEIVRYSLVEFIDKAVCPILANYCGIELDIANMFVTHLLYEGLANALQHPKATIGMFSLSRTGKDTLVLAIADNGEPIQKTIYEHFRRHHHNNGHQLPEEYLGRGFPADLRGDIMTHATMEGVSRKALAANHNWQTPGAEGEPGSEDRIGLGLTHIRDASTEKFQGNLILASDGVSVRYKTPTKDTQTRSDLKDFDFCWPGNLLRIQIPAKERQR